MERPIFETSCLGFKASLFKDRLVYKPFLGSQIIPISKIASVEVGMPGLQQITVESTGGKSHKLVVRLRDKQKLVELITRAINTTH